MSKYFKYDSSFSFNVIPIAWINLGYLLSFLLLSITAIAFGISFPASWWSVIMVSIPREFAYSISSIADIPQSTVIIKLHPFFEILSIASLFNPYPSINLFGIYVLVSTPISFKKLFNTVILVIPSTS